MASEDADAQHTEGEDAGAVLPHASSYHVPVLCNTVIDYLVTNPSGVYVDGTLGGGGHTAALLEVLAPDARVIGLDQDAEARAEASERLAPDVTSGRLTIAAGNFGNLDGLAQELGLEEIDGLLLDLGISSHQIDVPERGFSYAADGALDMRMNASAPGAADEMVNTWSDAELIRVLRAYGEESRAPRIVRAIVEARPLTTTTELADVIRSAVPTRDEVKTLSRVFQALRIAVNDELGALERVLEAARRLVRIGGRIAVISYHSLEDRRVKRYLRYGNFEGTPRRDLYGTLLTPWNDLTRKPIMPDDDEIDANPRARSARLRVAERVEVETDTPRAMR